MSGHRDPTAVRNSLGTERLVFGDEMRMNISSSPLYAWAPKEQKAYCSLPRNRSPNTTVLPLI
jgi:hypothetical protein